MTSVFIGQSFFPKVLNSQLDTCVEIHPPKLLFLELKKTLPGYS